MTKKILLTILAFSLVSCGLISATCITGAASLTFGRPTPTMVLFTPSPTLTVDQSMNQIEKQVSGYRGLTLGTTLKRALMTSTQLQDKVVNDFFKDYKAEDAKQDAEVLSAMGLLDPNFDLLSFYTKLYAEQIAGYYDNKTKEMYVISDESFGGVQRMTYAHEFTHALQDKAYDFENGLKYNDDYCKDHTEYCAGVDALIEGDATLSEYYWYSRYSTTKDQQQVAEFQSTYSSPVYDSAPAYMKLDFMFPYSQGYEFANYLYGSGGWDAIDAAFKNPPVDTEQILHPDKYPTDVPIEVTVPDMLPVLGSGWTEVERNVMGEWYTYLILGSGRDTKFQMPDEQAKVASAGWGGDTYVYYNNPTTGKFAFVWVTQWDTTQDANEFANISLKYGTARWGIPTAGSKGANTWKSSADGLVYIQQTGDQVIWLMTPNDTIQTAVLKTLAGVKK
jgi:hypothetical protein